MTNDLSIMTTIFYEHCGFRIWLSICLVVNDLVHKIKTNVKKKELLVLCLYKISINKLKLYGCENDMVRCINFNSSCLYNQTQNIYFR